MAPPQAASDAGPDGGPGFPHHPPSNPAFSRIFHLLALGVVLGQGERGGSSMCPGAQGWHQWEPQWEEEDSDKGRAAGRGRQQAVDPPPGWQGWYQAGPGH